MIRNISFCILRSSLEREPIRRAVSSITKQQVSEFEILLHGPDPGLAGVKTLPADMTVDDRYLNRARNQLLAHAGGDYAVLIKDTIELASDWYAEMKHADFLDVVASRIVTTDGTRAADWACRVQFGSRFFAYPLNYDEWTTKAYVDGDLMLLRRKTWEWLRFDETLQSGAGDAADFSFRATRAGFKIGVFPNAQAACLDAAGWQREGGTFEASRKTVASFKAALAAAQESFRRRDYAQAIAVLSPAIEMVPDEVRALGLTGWCHYFNAQNHQASTYFDRALAIAPDNHSALRGRGWAAIQMGDHEQAVEFLSRARATISVDKRDDWIETLRGLAWSNYHAGNYDDAISGFADLRENCADHETGLLQDILRGLGWSLYRKGLLTDASVHFRKAIEVLANGNAELSQDARLGLELTGNDSHGPQRHAEECQAPLVSLISKQGEPAGDHRSVLRRSLSALLRLFKIRGEA